MLSYVISPLGEGVCEDRPLTTMSFCVLLTPLLLHPEPQALWSWAPFVRQGSKIAKHVGCLSDCLGSNLILHFLIA